MACSWSLQLHPSDWFGFIKAGVHHRCRC